MSKDIIFSIQQYVFCSKAPLQTDECLPFKIFYLSFRLPYYSQIPI